MIKLTQYEDTYVLNVDGREGDVANYGDVASVTDEGGVEYIAQVEVNGDEIVSSLGDSFVYRAVPSSEVQMEAEEETEEADA